MRPIKRLTVPAFGFAKKLDPERRQLLSICGEFLAFESGEVIIHEGDVHDELFLVVEGELMLRRKIDAHSFAPLGTAKRGSSFGEMNLFHPVPARTTFLATSAGVLWKIRKDQFDAMLADDLVIAREVLSYICETLSRRLRRATERYVNTKEEYDQLFGEWVEEHTEAATPGGEVTGGEAAAEAASGEPNPGGRLTVSPG
ncbi:MAG: cyclic nucleotide-binding domain-containing protein [Prosthecobacter sp.]|nr:cyclic nucleotide-binding domain-containing protein [Prosthecobacter sp.]